MGKDLYEYTNEELIGIIQDYQEMTSDLESFVNEELINNNHTAIAVRDIINKYICKT